MRFSMLVAIVMALGAPAVAAPEPIVVVSDDTAFRAAVADALAPAGMVVRVATDPPPSIADITGASRAIAEREHATSTVWLVVVDAGSTLIAYDRGVDRVLVRPLPYAAPLSAPQAAEAARMTRTMLRALRVTPDTDLPPPPAAAAPAVRARAAEALAPQPIGRAGGGSGQRSIDRRFAIDVAGGVRMRGPGATAAPAGTLGAIWRPDGLGVTAAVRLAPAADISGALTGAVSDRSAVLAARLPITAWFATTAGVALHRIALAGTLEGQAIENVRYDPAVRTGATLTYPVNPWIDIGFAVSADWLLRRQTYAAGVDDVLTVPRIQADAGVVVVARIL